MAGAHLVGDRADAADPGGDVGDLARFAALKEGLEEAGRLEDIQLHVLDRVAVELDVEGAFPFDPGQCLDLECAIGWHRGLLRPGSSESSLADRQLKTQGRLAFCSRAPLASRNSGA